MSGTGLYQQDIIAPTDVHHLVEYGDIDPQRPGEFGHWYNFIDYIFEDGDGFVRARHYLDEPGVALIMSMSSEDAMMLKVMVFLLMRYEQIQWLGEEGYEPVPEPVMEKVRRALDAHLASHAD